MSVPANDWDGEARSVAVEQTVASRTGPDPDTMTRLAMLLCDSHSPVIIVGAGVDSSAAWDLTVSLAEALSAPVWAAPQAPRAGFPEDHPLFQGHLPTAQEPLAQRLVGHDLALLLGAPAFAYLTYVEGSTPLPKLAQVSEDPEEVARADTAVGVVGDIRLAVERLLAQVPRRTVRVPQVPRSQPQPQPQSDPIQSGYLMQELAAALPEDAILVEESTSNRLEMREHIRIRRPGTFFATASGGLGFAVPAAVGMKLARPERPVVCLVGDGSAMYAPQALWTAAQHRLDVLFVVANNCQYGILRTIAAETRRENVPGVMLPGIDYAAIARGLGCTAQRVERASDLPSALRRGLAGGPHLVEVLTAPPLTPR